MVSEEKIKELIAASVSLQLWKERKYTDPGVFRGPDHIKKYLQILNYQLR